MKYKFFLTIKLCTHAKTELFEIELIIRIKMDLALNNLQRLICHKTQTTNQSRRIKTRVYCSLILFYRCKESIHSETELIINSSGTIRLILSYLPTPLLGQDMTTRSIFKRSETSPSQQMIHVQTRIHPDEGYIEILWDFVIQADY